MPADLWIQNLDVQKRVICGKTLLITVRGKNRLLILNCAGSAIWDKLDRAMPRGCEDIARDLQMEHPEMPFSTLISDVRSFLTHLQDEGFAFCVNSVGLDTQLSLSEKIKGEGHLSFSEDLHRSALESNTPISGCIEVTQRCHLRCVHCYIDDVPIQSSRELPTAKWLDLLDQMADMGCLWLLITGGEPLLRRDFSDIYCRAKRLGMIVTVFTSATTLTRREIDLFTAYPPFLIESTLHGATPETFERITGTPGSFERFKQGTELLRQNQIPFNLKMIVMRQNIHEVEAARVLALQLGADDFRIDPIVNADFLHSGKVVDLRITTDEALRLDLLEPYRRRWQQIFQDASESRNASPPSRGLLFPCRAGKCSFSISPEGNLLPCILMRTPFYSLCQVAFTKAWQKLNRYIASVPMAEDNPCLQCPAQTCSMCPAWGQLEHGDPNAKSSFVCTLQREREQLFLASFPSTGG